MEKRENSELVLHPIAHIYTDFKEKFGVPRQSGRVKGLRAKIIFEEPYGAKEALRGIEGFSHIWLIWGFSENDCKGWSPTVRPPRLGGNKRVGVFATRSPNRPNPLGLSCVRLIEVTLEKGKPVLTVEGSDTVSGTPIYDVKPYLSFADSIPDAVNGFAADSERYALKIDVPEELLLVLPKEKREPLLGVLREDPRPSYQNDRRSYGMNFAGFEISFFVDEEQILHVTDIKKS